MLAGGDGRVLLPANDDDDDDDDDDDESGDAADDAPQRGLAQAAVAGALEVLLRLNFA